MNNDDDPDLVAAGFKRLGPVNGRPKMIAWGDGYKAWPDAQKILYLEKLSSSMNHAASMMQNERNRLSKIATHQEAQLKQNIIQYEALGEQMHRELVSADAEKQELYQQIVALTSEVKALKKVIKAHGDHR